jgi:hypothetical protein
MAGLGGPAGDRHRGAGAVPGSDGTSSSDSEPRAQPESGATEAGFRGGWPGQTVSASTDPAYSPS